MPENSEAPPPSDGHLGVTDSRTGAEYRIGIERGAVRAADLKRVSLGGDDPGLVAYDPAFKNTAACISRITFIDGEKGILRYRGYPIEELAERATYLEVAWLLLHGELPSAAELGEWREAVAREQAVPEPLPGMLRGFAPDAHPMAIFIALLAGVSALHPEAKAVTDPERRAVEIRRLIALAPGLVALAHRKASGTPLPSVRPDLGFAGNFLNQVFGDGSPDFRPDPVLERAMEVLFILHADHEQNCSTSAMRGVGSARTDPCCSAAAAAAALYGPLHGGANEAVLRMLTGIGSVAEVPAFLEGVKAGERRLMGFGHRVYKSYDPRARIIKKTAYEVFEVTGRNPRIDIALELERIALEEDYFVRRRLYPNVDFYSGIIYEAMGFPVGLFPLLFAAPRMSGWLAQWQEMLEDPEQKIARPLQLYLGEPKRSLPANRA